MSGGLVRLVFLVSTLRRAGPTTQLLNIIRHLDRGTFLPRVVTISPEGSPSMIDEYRAAGIEVNSLALSRIRGAMNRNWRSNLERTVGGSLAGRVVLHSQGIRADVIASKYLHGVKRLATARNYPHDDYPMKFGPLLGRWMARSHLRALRALPVVIACSGTLAALLRRHGVESSVIRNGVDTACFRPARLDERARLRQHFAFVDGERVGVCVGELSQRKNPLAVIRALRSMNDRDLRMVFAGGGALEADCRREAAGDARIRFLGHVGEIVPLLQAADFLVSASRSEGLPNGVLEAIACGLPCALSDIGPHRELLEIAPWAGVQFPGGDEIALQSAMRLVASPSRQDAGAVAAQVVELIGAERMSHEYQRLYLRLADGHVAP
jgi:glycosyltransferase involved in cell wall biosynthesis